MVKPSCMRLLNWLKKPVHHFVDASDNVLNEEILRKNLVIDKKETARSMVYLVILCIKDRFELACLYCLDTPVEKLWNQLDDEQKKAYSDTAESYVLMKYWAVKMEGKKERKECWMKENYEYLLNCLIRDGNEVAIEYLLKKESKPNLVSLAITAANTRDPEHSHMFYTPVLCKFLNAMNEYEKNQLLKFPDRFSVLRHIVDIPPYEEMYRTIWQSNIPEWACQGVLEALALGYLKGRVYTPNMFVRVWKECGKLTNESKKRYNRIGKTLLQYVVFFGKQYFEEIVDGATSYEKRIIANYALKRKNWSHTNFNIELVEVIVKKCFDTEAGKKQLLKNVVFSGGTEMYVYLIISNKLEKFEKLRSEFWDRNCDFQDIKKRFFYNNIGCIVVNLYMNRKMAQYDGFLSWYFADENAVKEFKQNFVVSCEMVMAVIYAIYKKGQRFSWSQYIDVFRQCSNMGEDEFQACFQEDHHIGLRETYVGSLLDKSYNKVELADEFLMWSFDDDDNKVREFLKDFISANMAAKFCCTNVTCFPGEVKQFLQWAELSEEKYENIWRQCERHHSGDKLKTIFREVFGREPASVPMSLELVASKRKHDDDENGPEMGEKRPALLDEILLAIKG